MSATREGLARIAIDYEQCLADLKKAARAWQIRQGGTEEQRELNRTATQFALAEFAQAMATAELRAGVKLDDSGTDFTGADYGPTACPGCLCTQGHARGCPMEHSPKVERCVFAHTGPCSGSLTLAGPFWACDYHRTHSR